MAWLWDAKKSQANRRKHGLGFETAALVFDDPLAATRPDANPTEERWQTIGMIGGVAVFVVHTWPQPQFPGAEPIGRIIRVRTHY